MASQTTVKALRSQPTRLLKKAHVPIPVFKQAPKTASSNSCTHNSQDSRASSCTCRSQLPVPVVKKATALTKNKSLSDKGPSSSSTSKAQMKNPSHGTSNAAVHPNKAKLLAPQHTSTPDQSICSRTAWQTLLLILPSKTRHQTTVMYFFNITLLLKTTPISKK